MFMWVQVGGIVFALGMLYLTHLHFKRGEFNKQDYHIWIIIWVAFILAVVFPYSLETVMETVDIVRVLDFFMIAGFMVLFAFVFTLHAAVRKNEAKLGEVVRQMSLENAKRKKR